MCVEVPVVVGSLEVREHPGAHTPLGDPPSGEPTPIGTSPTT